MARFRSAQKQAQHAVNMVNGINTPRHCSKNDGKIHSVGGMRNYKAGLKSAGKWLVRKGNRQGLDKMTPELAEAFLKDRAKFVVQKTLDRDRQALQFLPGIQEKLAVIQSQIPNGKLGQESRAYSQAQINLIMSRQSAKHALSTSLAKACGLRVHELYTIRPEHEQPADPRSKWSGNRFLGLSGYRYTVIGKGGLIRVIIVPFDLAEKLEECRLDEPVNNIDRDIIYESHYDLAAGQSLSQNFSEISATLFNWSKGIHGLRHGYVQTRMDYLQSRGFTFNEALEIVAQEVGHFNPETTLNYLR